MTPSKSMAVAGRVTLSGIVASDATADAAVKLAALYSKEVTQRARRSLRLIRNRYVSKCGILEVDRSKLLQFGINLFNPGGNTSFLAATTTSQYPSTATLAGQFPRLAAPQSPLLRLRIR